MVGKPVALETTVKDETRVVIHTCLRDLLRIIAKRERTRMGKIIWNALAEYWINRGYNADMLRQILDPPCPSCGNQHNNHSEAERERLVQKLTSNEWRMHEEQYLRNVEYEGRARA